MEGQRQILYSELLCCMYPDSPVHLCPAVATSGYSYEPEALTSKDSVPSSVSMGPKTQGSNHWSHLAHLGRTFP
jgi:hypothetical protein